MSTLNCLIHCINATTPPPPSFKIVVVIGVHCIFIWLGGCFVFVLLIFFFMLIWINQNFIYTSSFAFFFKNKKTTMAACVYTCRLSLNLNILSMFMCEHWKIYMFINVYGVSYHMTMSNLWHSTCTYNRHKTYAPCNVSLSRTRKHPSSPADKSSSSALRRDIPRWK